MPKFITRYDKYKDESFDIIMLKIKTGVIKCGKYSHLVKVDPKDESILKEKELFTDGQDNPSK